MKSAAVIIIFSIVLVFTSCCSPTTPAPASQLPDNNNHSMRVEKLGKLRKQLEEGIDRQVAQMRSELGGFNEQKRLKSLGEELKRVIENTFLDSVKLDLTMEDMRLQQMTEDMRQKVGANLNQAICEIQWQAESDNERKLLFELQQQVIKVYLAVFAKP